MENQNLFGRDGLADLGLRAGVDMRPTLLRVLTDLYVQKLRHTPDEERHYAELALRLLESVDLPTRVAVARRLARNLSPPLRVLQQLARDLPEVAEAVRSHPLLRSTAPADASTLCAGQTAEVGTDDASLCAIKLTGIDTATAYELTELFFAAGTQERRLILRNLDVVAPLPAGCIDIAREASVGHRLEAAALARNREGFAQQLSQALRIPRQLARRIAGDELGEPVVVAGKALGIAHDAFYRILMFLNPVFGHSVERVHALAELYDAIASQAADGMIAIWQTRQNSERQNTHYRPLTFDDRTRAHRRSATVVPQIAAFTRAGGRRNAS